MRSIIVISSMNRVTDEFDSCWAKSWSGRSFEDERRIIKIDCGENRTIFVLNGIEYFDISEKTQQNLISLLGEKIRTFCIEKGTWDRALLFHFHDVANDSSSLINELSKLQIKKSKEYHHKTDEFYDQFIAPFGERGCNDAQLFESLWNEVVSGNVQTLGLLASLDILLQGYLLIRDPEAVLGSNLSMRLKGRRFLLEGSKFKSFPIEQRLFRPINIKGQLKNGVPSNQFDLGWYWFDECLSDVRETSYESLVEKCELLKGKDNLKMLWDLLRGVCLGKPDGRSIDEDCNKWGQNQFTKFFAEAHKEYSSLCDKEN